MKIIKINELTIYFLFLLFICGYIKVGIIIFLIIIIHELGHVFIAKIFKYKVLNVTIYPFGGITKLEKDLNTPVQKELLIAFGGIFFQILLYFLIYFLPLDYSFKLIFYKYNKTIILFNILPIIPLDGSIILNSILNIFISFKKALKINIIVSFIMVIIYILINYKYSLNNYLIISLFILKIYDSIKNYRFVYNRFLLERYLNDYNFKKISTKKGNLDILKIDTLQYFKCENKVISEKKYLQEMFDK